MSLRQLTIKQLTEAVGGGITPRMVRHYEKLGLLPDVQRSSANYRLYSEQDVQWLRRIVALKQQGFKISHVKELLAPSVEADASRTLTAQLQQHYRVVIQQLAQLRQTASALETMLGRDKDCKIVQAEVIAQLRRLEVETSDGIGEVEKLWNNMEASAHAHPEAFHESLEQLLPELGERSEIEVDLIHKLVLACGDVSLVHFVRCHQEAIAAARHTLKAGCQVVGDVPAVVAALDSTRLAHLGCEVKTLIEDPHVSSVADAEQAFWGDRAWIKHLQEIPAQSILAIGYAPSVLISACSAIERGEIQPALVIGMPIGFSHAPTAKRWLMRLNVPYITIEGSMVGGLLAAVALNALAESLIEKPDCHCYLNLEKPKLRQLTI